MGSTTRTRSLFAALSLVVLFGGGGVSYLVYQSEKTELVETASQELQLWSGTYAQTLKQIFEPALTLSRTIADSGIWDHPESTARDIFFSIAVGPVRKTDHLNGAFIGFPDGRFLHVQDKVFSGERTRDDAPPELDTVRRRIIDAPSISQFGRWENYNVENRQWEPDAIKSTAYDPRSRSWYQQAVEMRGPIWTEPYIFSSSGKLGITYAQPIYDRNGNLWAVLGTDISLTSLSQSMVTISEAFKEVGNLVFATDLANDILGHPDFVGQADSMGQDTEAFLAKYNEPSSVESLVVAAVPDFGTVVSVQTGGGEYIATKAALDPAQAMPLQIFLARDLEVVMAQAEDRMERRVTLLFAGIIVFGIVALYAVKLRVEVRARQAVEAALVDAKEDAEAATKAKSTFLATMSHEIRTPMNGVISMAELLTLTRLDAEQRRMAKVINDSALALLTIINDILDFSKIEAGKIEIEKIDVSLMDIVDGSAELLAPRAEEKDLSLIVDIDPQLIDSRTGDPTRIRQILLNLGGNAIKFTENGTIEFRIRAADKTGDRVRFEIRDSGIGLTEEQQSRLFQAFTQADTSTSRKYGGTGLGLSICQRLTDLMDGQIGVESEPGQGSVFWFELPLPTVETLAPAYSGDISGAAVQLIGLPEQIAGIAEKYLRAGGVTDVHVVPNPDPDALKQHQETDALWIVDASLSQLDVYLSDTHVPIAVVGTRKLVSDLTGLRVRASSIVTLPLSRLPLWRSVAIAIGIEVADVTEDRADLSFSPPDIEAARAQNALILVAEDNATNQIVIRQMLGKMGFACEVADNGKIAWSMLETPGYGLLLTDINMPEMDGFELSGHVRAAESRTGQHLPILALTADALSGTDQACQDAGIDGYFTKPIDSRALGAALAERMPQAVALRVAESPTGGPADIPERGPESTEIDPAPTIYEIDWDPDIFDPDTLSEAFGGIDQEAKGLIEAAADTWDEQVAAIRKALEQQDWQLARETVHSLKGSSQSVGARRLGRIASDIQEALDDGDNDMAFMFANVLEPTVGEFRQTLPKILKL